MKERAMKTTKWDSAKYLTSEAAMAEYLSAMMEDGDPRAITHALGVVARARGMSRLARKSGVTREALYRALNADGNPEFATVLKVINAMGLKLSVKAA
jgi:probable addiction module antidote protein